MKDETRKTVGRVFRHTATAAGLSARKPWVQKAAKLGFYVKGSLFVVIGSLAVMLAIGSPGGDLTDPRGALATTSQRSFGWILLILFALGATGHGVWNLLRATADIDGVGAGIAGIVRRSVAAGIGVFYLGLAVSAVEIALSARAVSGNSVGEETFVSILLMIPVLGTVMLVIIGLGLVVASVSEAFAGISGQFLKTYRIWEVKGTTRAIMMLLGIISFSARAVLLAIMGYFFLRAAYFGLDGAIGIDAALMQLLLMDYGPLLVLVIGSGLIGHGILAFYEAKYRRISKKL